MKHFNIAHLPKPCMPWGYYTPLMKLKDESPYTTDNPTGASPYTSDQNKSSSATDKFNATVQVQKTAALSEPPQNPFTTKKTALKIAMTAFSLFSCAVLFSNFNNPSLSTSNECPQTLPPNSTFQVLSHSLAATSAELATFSKPVTDIAVQALQKGAEVFNTATASFAAKYYSISRELQEVPLTTADQKVLDIRNKYPSFFKSRFISDILGGSDSATAKAIRLSVSKGETSIPFAQLCSLTDQGAGKCALDLIETPEILHKNTVGTPQTLKEYREDLTHALNENEEVQYQEYLRSFTEKQAKVNEIVGRVKPEIFAELQEAHYAQCEATSDFVKSKFMYFSQEIPTGTEFSALAHLKAERRHSITRNEYERPNNDHETRALFSVSELFESGSRHIYIDRHVWSSHEKGKEKSNWDKFSIECGYDPAEEEIHCTSALQDINHAYGKTKYTLREQKLSSKCSMITESFQSPAVQRVHQYALNPKKNLPIIFSQIVDSEKFISHKKKTFSAQATGNMDAVATFSAELPKTLPKTCEELASLENPKPQISQSQ